MAKRAPPLYSRSRARQMPPTAGGLETQLLQATKQLPRSKPISLLPQKSQRQPRATAVWGAGGGVWEHNFGEPLAEQKGYPEALGPQPSGHPWESVQSRPLSPKIILQRSVNSRRQPQGADWEQKAGSKETPKDRSSACDTIFLSSHSPEPGSRRASPCTDHEGLPWAREGPLSSLQ